MKKALIFGITGQDGSYLAELLLSKGYEVHGMIRRVSVGNTKNIEHIKDKLHLHHGDLSDVLSLKKIIDDVSPDELYNQADQDLAYRSWDISHYNSEVTGGAVGEILKMIRDKNIKFLQPISSNIFGEAEETPQRENTPHNPRSPYACAKAFALNYVRMYRELGVFASTAILYNHESPRRTDEYVTRKITLAVAAIRAGKQDKLHLGDLSAKIDWGWSPEYVEAEWNILQLDKPGDFIICTGEAHTVQEFVEESFRIAGLDWKQYVVTDPNLVRKISTSTLIGDTTRAKEAFGFNPKIKFHEVVKKMTEYDIQDTSK